VKKFGEEAARPTKEEAQGCVGDRSLGSLVRKLETKVHKNNNKRTDFLKNGVGFSDSTNGLCDNYSTLV